MKLSDKITAARRTAGLTQEELALRAGITVRTIQRIESGESLPRLYTLRNIASALNVPLHDIDPTPESGTPVNNHPDEEHFLRLLCLSCFSYLVIPYVHFLIPQYMARKNQQLSHDARTLTRRILRGQIGWVILLHLSLLATLALNFVLKDYADGTRVIHYLWIVLGAYTVNVFTIASHLYRIKTVFALKTAI
jgi:XRE family transcriptional regulator, regulator of sulfur utilization